MKKCVTDQSVSRSVEFCRSPGGHSKVNELCKLDEKFSTIICHYFRLLPSEIRPVASGRHQGGAEEIQWGVTFGSKYLIDNFIVTQNSRKRLCLYCEETQKLSRV